MVDLYIGQLVFSPDAFHVEKGAFFLVETSQTSALSTFTDH